MGLICQGRNQNDVKYVIRLNSPVHVRGIRRGDVNATLGLTDGGPFVSRPSLSVHKGRKVLNDAVCGCAASRGLSLAA
jgi:hypothetical protein